MSSDVLTAAASPMTNGTSSTDGHGEANTSLKHSLRETCADLDRRVTKFLESTADDESIRRTQEQTRLSIQVIERALQEYQFDALSLSYNGGKDCLVLLILYLATLHSVYKRNGRNDFPDSIPSIYAKPPDPFPAVTAFVDSSSAEYHLDLVHISTNPGNQPNPAKARFHTSPPAQTDTDQTSQIVTFRDAFALYLSSHPQVQAIFVGTRRTDPHGAHLAHFQATDGNWPAFMRIHPVIDWHLSEIWAFLRSPHLAPIGKETLEYCTMYDEGYTSLGGIEDTLRNPKLRYIDSQSGEECFRPAYQLTQDKEERLGRE